MIAHADSSLNQRDKEVSDYAYFTVIFEGKKREKKTR